MLKRMGLGGPHRVFIFRASSRQATLPRPGRGSVAGSCATIVGVAALIAATGAIYAPALASGCSTSLATTATCTTTSTKDTTTQTVSKATDTVRKTISQTTSTLTHAVGDTTRDATSAVGDTTGGVTDTATGTVSPTVSEVSTAVGTAVVSISGQTSNTVGSAQSVRSAGSGPSRERAPRTRSASFDSSQSHAASIRAAARERRNSQLMKNLERLAGGGNGVKGPQVLGIDLSRGMQDTVQQARRQAPVHDSLPFTGAQIAGLLYMALTLLGSGGFLLAHTRRTRPAPLAPLPA